MNQVGRRCNDEDREMVQIRRNPVLLIRETASEQWVAISQRATYVSDYEKCMTNVPEQEKYMVTKNEKYKKLVQIREIQWC